MEEATASMTTSALNNDRYAADNRLHVEFYYKPKIDAGASEEAGRPVHKDTLYARITPPGGDTRDQPVDEITRARFADRIAKYEAANRVNEEIEGFMLSEWPAITRSQAEDLKYMKIHTVEQLAVTPDVNLQGIMGGMGLKTKAKEWMESSSGSDARLKELEDTNAALMARLEALESGEKPKRRGRPPKSEVEA